MTPIVIHPMMSQVMMKLQTLSSWLISVRYPNSSIDSQKYVELQNAFEELHEELENLGAKYIALKKNFSMLSNELNDLLRKENEAISELKSQNDSLRKEKEDLSSKDFSSNDLKKENDDLRDRKSTRLNSSH